MQTNRTPPRKGSFYPTTPPKGPAENDLWDRFTTLSKKIEAREGKCHRMAEVVADHRTKSTYIGRLTKAITDVISKIPDCLYVVLPLLKHCIIALAYLSYAAITSYNAVLNVGLLSLPKMMHMLIVRLISGANISITMIDWFIEHHGVSDHFPFRKVLSFERRFLRAPQLTFCDADVALHDKLCEEFASYLFLERSAREDTQKALLNPQKQDLFKESIPNEYPIEIKYRMAVARDASYDALVEQQTRITNMIKAYKCLANMTKSSDSNFMAKLHDIICNDDVMRTGAFERNQTAINKLRNLAFPDSRSGTHDVALFTTLRFAYFASRYAEACMPGVTTKKDQMLGIMQWQLQQFLAKRIKKESSLLNATHPIGWLAFIIVWGNALLVCGLQVLANAPINLICQWLQMNCALPLRIWFYFVGYLMGVSSDSIKNFLVKMNQYDFTHECKKCISRLQQIKMSKYIDWGFRIAISMAAAISTCIFSYYSIKRLLIVPLCGPVMTTLWVTFTVITAAMNLYELSKFYSLENLDLLRAIAKPKNHIHKAKHGKTPQAEVDFLSGLKRKVIGWTGICLGYTASGALNLARILPAVIESVSTILGGSWTTLAVPILISVSLGAWFAFGYLRHLFYKNVATNRTNSDCKPQVRKRMLSVFARKCIIGASLHGIGLAMHYVWPGLSLAIQGASVQIILPAWILLQLVDVYRDFRIYNIKNLNRDSGLMQRGETPKDLDASFRNMLPSPRSFITLAMFVGAISKSMMYYASIIKTTTSQLLVAVLPLGVFLTNYAKMNSLFERVLQLMQISKSAPEHIKPYGWHKKAVQKDTKAIQKDTMSELPENRLKNNDPQTPMHANLRKHVTRSKSL